MVILRAFALMLLVAFAPRPGLAEEGDEFPVHVVEAFLGGATRLAGGHSESGFAWGAGYEFRFSRWLGTGITVEAVSGELRDVLVVVPLFVHPWRGLRLEVAPGAEFSKEPTEFAIRFGIAYEFGIWRRLSLTPEFNVDLADGEETLVYGLAVGWEF